MIPPQVNGATSLQAEYDRLTTVFPMIPPQVNGATSVFLAKQGFGTLCFQ